jgi:hypothetical protein
MRLLQTDYHVLIVIDREGWVQNWDKIRTKIEDKSKQRYHKEYRIRAYMCKILHYSNMF